MKTPRHMVKRITRVSWRMRCVGAATETMEPRLWRMMELGPSARAAVVRIEESDGKSGREDYVPTLRSRPNSEGTEATCAARTEHRRISVWRPATQASHLL